MPSEIEILTNKLKNLAQYKNKTEEELRQIVEKKLGDTGSLDEELETLFINRDEKKLAKELLSKYLQEYSLENISDKNLLKQLIYLEVFQTLRLQKAADEFQKEQGNVPIQLLDAIHRNLDKIVYLKERLGLVRKESHVDAVSIIDQLKKKFKIWKEQNQASRTLVCGHCGGMLLLRIRTEGWESQKNPFFQDRVLYSEHLVRLYLEKKITKEDIAQIFEVSPDYVDWLVEKMWRTNPSYQEIEKEIKNNDKNRKN